MLKKGPDRPLRAANRRPSAPSSVCPASGHHRSERRSCDSRRQHVKQRFTYSGFPGCRGARHPGCSAHDSTSFAHGPVNRTCSMARNPYRSLTPHILVHVLWAWQRFHRVNRASERYIRLSPGDAFAYPPAKTAEKPSEQRRHTENPRHGERYERNLSGRAQHCRPCLDHEHEYRDDTSQKPGSGPRRSRFGAAVGDGSCDCRTHDHCPAGNVRFRVWQPVY